MQPTATTAPTSAPPGLRPWQRLGVRLAGALGVVTLCAVGAAGAVTYQRHQRELADTVGTQLLNIARVTALAVDPALHAEVQRSPAHAPEAYERLRARLAAIGTELVLTTPLYTLADYDASRGQARVVVVSDDTVRPGETRRVAPEAAQALAWTFEDGVARYTGLYRDARGAWITAFAPVVDRAGLTTAVLAVDYPVEIFLDRLHELRATILLASALGGLATLLLGLLLARRLTRPIVALTAGVRRVTDGDLSRPLEMVSRDEVGQLTWAFNEMLRGLRQRDFIRSAFGRYVSPEVARALLDSPEGLRFGGARRVVTALMADLRGYTRFSEHGDPAAVMDVLNRYLGRMTDIIIAHGGTINDFIGDAIFAVFGAPLDHPDHAERAAACALAMQRAMAELGEADGRHGLPRFEMGIGVNTGEAVAGNVGSEQRAKYAIVGSAVNVAARVESATVGGQVFITEATLACIRDIADVAPPLTVQAKGLSAPLLLHELRGLGGRFGPLTAPAAGDAGEEREVSLPLACWTIEHKVVGDERRTGEVVRLGRRGLVARVQPALAPLADVRLRLGSPDGSGESGDIYGKVVRVEADAAGRPLARVHFTAIGEAEAALVDTLRLAATGAAPGEGQG